MSLRPGFVLRWVFLAALALESSAFAAGETAELEKARAAYVSRNYDDAEKRLRAVLDPERSKIKDPVLIGQARMYLGATLIQRGSKDDGSKVFEALLEQDPQYEPDPLTFSTNVIEVFIDTRARIRERLAEVAEFEAKKAAERRAKEAVEARRAAAQLRLLEAQAAEESLVVRNTREVAVLPFGVGQFQNRQYSLGWVFLGTEAAFLIGSVITVPFYSDARSAALREVADGDPLRRAAEYNDRARTFQTVNLALAGAFVVTWGLGVLQAELNFVPEFREKRRRPVPQLGLRPTVEPAHAGTGGTLGVAGNL